MLSQHFIPTVKACQKSFMIPPERKQFLRFSGVSRWLNCFRHAKSFFFSVKNEKLRLIAGWTDCELCQKLHCVMQQMKIPTLIPAGKAGNVWVMFLTNAVHRCKLIYNSFSLPNLFILRCVHFKNFALRFFNLVDVLSRQERVGAGME